VEQTEEKEEEKEELTTLEVYLAKKVRVVTVDASTRARQRHHSALESRRALVPRDRGLSRSSACERMCMWRSRRHPAGLIGASWGKNPL
jgi:hypothetical protein